MSDLDSEWTKKSGSSPDFADFARQLAYDKTSYYGNGSYFTPFSVSSTSVKNTLELAQNTLPDGAFKDYGTTKFATTKKDNTTLFLIDSEDRDKAAFPQPASFSLKPPRVYKNVTGIQVAQLKLLCSFYFFSVAKGNTFLPVIERGREKANVFLSYPLTKAVVLNEGSYAIGDLMNQLQNMMNYTPLFYDYPTGISGFITAFTTSGDYGANFNQPGDYYTNPLTGDTLTNPTMDQIVLQYWSVRFAGLSAYSIDQIKVAYYYPVLYEAFLDSVDTVVTPRLNITVPSNLLSEGETVFTRIIYNFSGLNDPVVLYLINDNINLLDTYRLNHTFRFSLINRYELSKNAFTLRVNVISRSLNTSLVNLINLKRSQGLALAIQNAGLTAATFSNTSNTLNASKLVFNEMYNYIQTQLTTYFAVGFATFASGYFLNPNNVMFIQNGLDAEGVRTGYTLEYLTSGQTPITSTSVSYSNSPGYWPSLTGGPGGGIDPSGVNVSSSMIAYNVTSSNFQYGTSVIDSSNFFINTNRSTRSVDAIITIKPAKYTVFKFRSQTRQTLQVETMPLPYYYRFADYNKAGLYKSILDQNACNMPQKYFDLSYSFLYVSTGTRFDNSKMDSSNYSSLTLSLLPSVNFSTAFALSPVLPLNVQSNYTQFEFTVPRPSSIATGLYANTTNVSFVSVLSNQSTTFTTNVNAFVYHDRGAFMADLNSLYLRKENPLHYIVSSSATVLNSDLTIQLSTFTGQKYYTIFRSQGATLPNMQFSPVVYANTDYTRIKTDYVNFNPLANPTSASNLTNYPFITNYNTDFLRLPVNSTLQGIDPSDPKYALNTSVGNYPIGYDAKGVSDDLTDYRGYIPNQRGFVPNSILRVDPLSQYTFQALTPFDSNAYTYFDDASQNQILEPITNQPYDYKGTSTGQIKILHWYDGYSIPRQIEDNFATSNTISSAITSSVQDYVQGFTRDANGVIQFGRGINAIGFLPTDGLYTISSFSFKSAIYPIQCISTTAEDPNTLIKYVGVYSGASLESGNIQISSALAVLQFTKSQVYGPSTLALTPQFGLELGTWYEYGFDSNFIPRSNVKLNGYTQGSNELVNYTSMFYVVPFNAEGSNITYSRLTGSLLPYPLSQVVSSGSTYFGQSNTVVTGAIPQSNYLMPSTVFNANPAYGPQGTYGITQSQYELSQPITTTSFGYKIFGFLVQNSNALFPFTTTFSNSISTIHSDTLGQTTFFSEYYDNLYLVNSLSNGTGFSNANLTFTGALYASTISTTIGLRGGTPSSAHYLYNTPSTLQNYPYIGLSNFYSTFTFSAMPDAPSTSITTQSLNLDLFANKATFWLWGGGGASNGGAGAYAKAEINLRALSNYYQVSTLYFVVGKGGNTCNSLTQRNYGGAGVISSTYAQGGGFSGIFLGSNLASALPLVVVGGGGAGGENLGGPGGFGRDPPIQPVISSMFRSVVLTASNFPIIPFVSARNYDNSPETPYLNFPFNTTTPPGNMIDGNYETVYATSTKLYYSYYNFNPIIAPIESGGQLWAMNADLFTLNFASNVSTLSKLRIIGPFNPNVYPQYVKVFNDMDKSQQLNGSSLYPGSAVTFTDFGTSGAPNILGVLDIPITNVRSNTTLQRSGWIACGQGTSLSNALQYSLDGTNWANIRSQTGVSLSNVTAVVYAPDPINAWYACGSNRVITSVDGLNWTTCTVTGYTGTSLTAIVYNSATNTFVVGGTNSNSNTLLYSSDGITFSSARITGSFTSNVTNLQALSNTFWAVGTGATNGATIKYSVDGLAWTSLPVSGGITTGKDITFNDSLGIFVVAAGAGAAPYNGPILFNASPLLTTWTRANATPNLATFTCLTVAYGNGVIVAGGSTTDGSSPVKYSSDGLTWIDTDMVPGPYWVDPGDGYILTHTPGTTRYNDGSLDLPITVTRLIFTGGGFICLANITNGFVRCANQLNLMTSANGINWTMTSRGGCFSDAALQGRIPTSIPLGGAYGPLSIVPNLSTIYIEMAQFQYSLQIQILELQAYGKATSIGAPVGSTISTIIDNNFKTCYYPNESDTVGLTNYTMAFTLQSTVSTISELDIYVPNDPNRVFTGLQVSQMAAGGGITYFNNSITDSNFNYDAAKGLNYYTAYMTPPLNNVSTLYIDFIKSTPLSIQINEFQAVNNLNMPVVQYVPTTVRDINNYTPLNPNTGVANIIDGNLNTVWVPQPNAAVYEINAGAFLFTFNTIVPRINRIQIFNGNLLNYFYTATAVRIYTDESKEVLLFSKAIGPTLTNLFVTNLTYQLIECDILPTTNVFQLYIELDKNYENSQPLIINEIRFFGFGVPGDTSFGFTGGTLQTMQRQQAADVLQDGGGGSATLGGLGGTDGSLPSRAVLYSNVLTAQNIVRNDSNIIVSTLTTFSNAQSTILGEINFISTLDWFYTNRSASTVSTVNGNLRIPSSLISTYTSTLTSQQGLQSTLVSASNLQGYINAKNTAQLNYSNVLQFSTNVLGWSGQDEVYGVYSYNYPYTTPYATALGQVQSEYDLVYSYDANRAGWSGGMYTSMGANAGLGSGYDLVFVGANQGLYDSEGDYVGMELGVGGDHNLVANPGVWETIQIFTPYGLQTVQNFDDALGYVQANLTEVQNNQAIWDNAPFIPGQYEFYYPNNQSNYATALALVTSELSIAQSDFISNGGNLYDAATVNILSTQSLYNAVYPTYLTFLSTATRPTVFAPFVTNVSTTSTIYGQSQTQLVIDTAALAQTIFALNNPAQGAGGFPGTYLAGGRPSSMGAGGGGGGMYGGGAGGRDSSQNGGAGGGGGGYFDPTPLVTILEYGVGTPGNSRTGEIQNFIPPFSTLQANLIASNALAPSAYTYGRGGYGTSGAHGVILANYDKPTIITPTDSSMTATPSFVDPSQLTVFTAPISYANDIRTLDFTTYADAIQSTQYAGYNWVWFRSFLLLTGATLLPSMTASTQTPTFPSSEFPFLPNLIYATLEEQYSNVLDFFAGNTSLAPTITAAVQLAFELHNQFFVMTVYTDPSYVMMSEVYCLLDYLRQPDTLINPHINPQNSRLDRVFGGIPRFGYWANPFLTNVSYVGFDVGQSLLPFPKLSSMVGQGPQQVQAFYGLTLEQNLSTGKYEYKEIMAYKPLASDSNWQTLTQFPESYSVRPLSNYYVNSNIAVQPYSAKSAIEAKLSLLNYRVYDAQAGSYTAPIEVINDFQSYTTYLYSFQNLDATNVSSVNLLTLNITSTMLNVNQNNIATQSNLPTTGIMGTVVSEYRSTTLQAVQQFGFSSNSFVPSIQFGTGTSNFYNSFSPNSQLPVSSIGKSITDFYGNLFSSDNRGSSRLFENICTIQIYQVGFSNSPLRIASPRFVLSQYRAGNQNPYYDFLQSRYKNIWHLQGTSNLSTIYGARLGSPFDFSIRTQFASQIFYPTHKIGLEQVGGGTSPIQNTYDLTDYPSYPRTQMFFYKNYSTLVADISGQFAMERTSNFTYSDTQFSGYFFNSFIDNINMLSSSNFDNNNTESFNYLAIRAYSPSETFKSLVRFYLPGRFDFGYITLKDLSNEIITLQGNSNVNPQYLTTLGLFTSSFTGLRTFGGTGLANFSGLNISSATFGNFLQQYSSVYTTINVNSVLVSSINSAATNSVTNLITGDLKNILPAYVATRETVTDPVEYSFPFSTVMQASNRFIEAYGLGYNLGFAPVDTALNTVQRANSFFKIFDDYIFMKMNVEQNMNRLDISRQEKYSITRDATAESQVYNCKLILNTFGSYATTLVQNPVTFNPPLGKLDKLSFTWYDITGQPINNDTCVWSASIQVTESVDVATPDSTLPKMG